MIGRASLLVLALLIAPAWLAGCVAGMGWLPGDNELLFNEGGTPTAIGNLAKPTFDSKPVFDMIAGKIGSHAPTLTSFADGELLAAWYSYDGPEELDGAAIYMARRRPGADAWEAPTLHIDRPEADGNPVLYSAGDAIWLFQAVVPRQGWSTAHIEVQRSDDRGVTWSQSRAIAGPLGSNVRYPPVQLADGRLLLPAYDDMLQRSLFFASADGEEWSLRGALTAGLFNASLQPSVAVLADGRVLAVLRNASSGWLWVSASDDAARTWTRPADSGFPNPASPAALVKLASGNLILVYNDSSTARRPLSITISADDGVTWQPARVLVDGAGEYAYPTVVQSPDGLIHIVYSHNRERIEHIIVNEAWVAATGAWFGPCCGV